MGTLSLWATEEGLRRIAFSRGPDLALPGERLSRDAPPAHLGEAVSQLRGYLAGDRRDFDLPLDFGGATPFQRQVWERLLAIPFGEVVTYGQVAHALGGDGAARAVGQAVGSNPLAIVVPCHRVVGSTGGLHGYGGGLEKKAWLLRLEGLQVDGERPTSKVRPDVLRLPL